MQSCKRATELMSQQLDRELSASEKLGLKMHLLMCRHCRKCEQQLGIIHQLCARRGDTPPDGE
ncbi:MAG: zf-HC2 domain-containing protein [Oceanospirillales bacterium]|uniref:Putative zinc finger protein n=1 Tax=Marinobacterium halophilum TaxID=267374 RepID=A0A2P8F4T7_9GAMM|nr:zf-HC2 domain-containing protein [Marinobacterium halophilum]MBR9828113.1 zf-HC2 domain-containing protein [Oceanospirillales bacterium]PSL16726.1 putative zinc finger protein [Marinobacterium halophilum]